MRRYLPAGDLVPTVLGPSLVRGDDQQIAQQIVSKLQPRNSRTLKGFSIDLQVDEAVWLSAALPMLISRPGLTSPAAPGACRSSTTCRSRAGGETGAKSAVANPTPAWPKPSVVQTAPAQAVDGSDCPAPAVDDSDRTARRRWFTARRPP
jgi:hypothetical protein